MAETLPNHTYSTEVPFGQYTINVISRERKEEGLGVCVFTDFVALAHPLKPFNLEEGLLLTDLKKFRDITNGPKIRDYHQWVCNQLMYNRKFQRQIREAIGLEISLQVTEFFKSHLQDISSSPAPETSQ